MDRRLIMMRHAKSSWSSDAPTDHARPLNKRGRRSARVMGLALPSRGWRPDKVVLSDSVRTQETLRGLAFDAGVEVELDPALYHGGIDAVRAAIARQSSANTLMLLGHEPGWSEAIEWLTGVEIELKTADAALIVARDAPNWAEVITAPGAQALQTVIRSREVLELSQTSTDVVP